MVRVVRLNLKDKRDLSDFWLILNHMLSPNVKEGHGWAGDEEGLHFSRGVGNGDICTQVFACFLIILFLLYHSILY